ncbi:MAG: cold-shock protein [Rhizobiaceae bacterium]
MGRYRDHRPRRQGFESDNDHEDSERNYFERRPEPSPPPSSAPASSPRDAEVLWFNAEKGFGFLRLSDGSEAFLHVSKLQAAGHDSLSEGAHLKVRTENGQKGPQVVEIVSVSLGNGQATPEPAARQASDPASAPDQQQLEGAGVVKRYDAEKGFGFVALESGGKDVFVHATALARSGLTTLEAGQRVIVSYIHAPKGLEARSIQLR